MPVTEPCALVQSGEASLLSRELTQAPAKAVPPQLLALVPDPGTQLRVPEAWLPSCGYRHTHPARTGSICCVQHRCVRSSSMCS